MLFVNNVDTYIILLLLLLCCCAVPPRRGPCAIECVGTNQMPLVHITSNDIKYNIAMRKKIMLYIYGVWHIIILLSAQFHYFYSLRVLQSFGRGTVPSYSNN